MAQPHNHTDALAAPARKGSSGAAQAATELLEAHPERPWSVGELARKVHLSTRALQQTFVRSIGLSPMRYLRQVCLARVHANLLEASPEETTVAEVAGRWGFIHHGHFAAAYRTRYGHPPPPTPCAADPHSAFRTWRCARRMAQDHLGRLGWQGRLHHPPPPRLPPEEPMSSRVHQLCDRLADELDPTPCNLKAAADDLPTAPRVLRALALSSWPTLPSAAGPDNGARPIPLPTLDRGPLPNG